MNDRKTNLKKAVLPILVVVISAMIILFIVNNKPSNERGRPQASAKILVEGIKLERKEFQVSIASFGIVKPRTQSVLVSQVSGQVSYISDSFRDGGFFEKGEMLVKIDERDYQAEVDIAKAALLNAEQSLLEEQARSKQALADWQRLGDGSEANDLVLRKPQLAAQQANVLSAKAKLDKAKLSLERTKIIAPYAGRILSKKVDVGQVVNGNTQLADIYATDYVEVRLPINNRDLAYIDLPEQNRFGQSNTVDTEVLFTSNLIGQQKWRGKLVRTESAIDNNSQQLYVVAQILSPFDSNKNAIKIGQYVNATIKGKTINNALLIPNEAIYQGTYVYVLQKGNLLKRVNIDYDWQNESVTLVQNGLKLGDTLITTPLGQVSSGTPVTLIGDDKGLNKAERKRERRKKERDADNGENT
ncbi:efflux RND transporter periplasmic adaptor subunit [Pseudoalteromonas phenolica]|uniref:Efflux RND transporter periplasmic adaptor subunit n=1 Tax=Pseudoalteromonas phenolica TaxID=161398 RepID=A0A5R9Q5X4_9GAMM|nr:efflux RND transporter periplasmic adaptor subunit [Pseudoalteromonas phenolica]TLX48548.1 efflux RND transporter periplasmic adaptor subunit [Pseudoalteromonas phenolica]